MVLSEQSTRSIDGAPSGYTLGAISVAAEDDMPNQEAGPRYRADITAGSLKVTESRRIADLLLHEVDADGWTDAIVKRNVLQARTPRPRGGSSGCVWSQWGRTCGSWSATEKGRLPRMRSLLRP
jgi:hypothetical protein